MSIVKSRAISGRSPLYLPEDAGAEWSVIDFDFPTTAPAIGDLWEIADLPIGMRCMSWSVVFPKIDSNGTPLLAFSIGVENAGATDLGSEVWATAQTAGQTSTKSTDTTSVAAQGDSTVIRRVTLKITAVAATWNGAGKTGQVMLLLAG